MRKLGVIMITGVLGATMYVAAPASASVSSRTFCEAYHEITADVGSVDSEDDVDFDRLRDGADDLASGYRKAAKSAPKKIKKAMKKIASYFEAIGDLDTERDFSTYLIEQGQTYAKAQATVTQHVISNCLGTTTTSVSR